MVKTRSLHQLVVIGVWQSVASLAAAALGDVVLMEKTHAA